LAILRLAPRARMDIAIILARAEENFGVAARQRYEALISASLRAIAADPFQLGSAARPEIGEGVRTYHLRHARARAKAAGRVRTPRHFLLYRCASPDIVGVGRVLHEAMELSRHIPAVYGDEN
jgi:toxin ParE1/3/4